MRKLGICLIFAALLLSACGAAAVGDQAGTAVSAPEVGTAISAPEVGTTISGAGDQAGTAISGSDAATALSQAATAISGPEASTAISAAGTAISGPEAGTAISAAGNALTAAEEDVTVKQGEQLVLDASKSVGADISDYKWTIEKAPAGAESVVGQTIKEGSSGNVSLSPDEYAKYFPKSGDYTVRLTITDSKGATSFDDFVVTVP